MPARPRPKNPMKGNTELAQLISDIMADEKTGEQPDPKWIKAVLRALSEAVLTALMDETKAYDAVEIPGLVTIRKTENYLRPLDATKGISQIKDGKRAKYTLKFQANYTIKQRYKHRQIAEGIRYTGDGTPNRR